MPRINIEEKWWGDPRRARLIELIGDRADGAMLLAIKLAQQYWIPNMECIPIKTWNGCEMPDALLKVGLAELMDDGKFIYVSGTKEHFEWWFKRQQAGRLGGLAKASNAKQSLAKPSKRWQSLPSSSSSSSKELITSSNCSSGATAPEPPPAPSVPEFDFLALYAKYPRKKGRAKGLEQCTKQIRTMAAYNALSHAIGCYAAEQRGQQEQYMLLFSTFMTSKRWLDYADQKPKMDIHDQLFKLSLADEKVLPHAG